MLKFKGEILLMVMIVALLLSIGVKAKSINISDYNSLTLQEALTEEGIEYNFANYKENDNQVKIYLFRGKGCSHCYDFLKFAADALIPEYGEMVKVITFETWSDSNNDALKNKIATRLGTKAKGVPFIIIGKKYWSGYNTVMNDDIIQAIKDEYNKEDKYDVFNDNGDRYTLFWIIVGTVSLCIIVLNVIKRKKSSSKKKRK